MSDLPLDLPAPLADRLAAALDVERKIPRALEALGPLAGREVALVDAGSSRIAGRLREIGAQVRAVDWEDTRAHGAAHDALGPWADALVSCWTAFRGYDPAEMAEANRLLRPGGRLLIVHDYGRDDVSGLFGPQPERPEYGEWSRRDGPFLGNGFRVRVVHCWWTFESIAEAAGFLGEAFGDLGRSIGGALKRPRLSYNVAIYHRTIGQPPAGR